MHLWTAFLLGFAGSLHCAGMCGPLLVALSKARPRSRRESAGRVFHHLGRVASYCALGLMFGLLGQLVSAAGFQRWLSLSLGVGLLLGLLVSAEVSLGTPVVTWIAGLKRSMGGLIQRDSVLSQATMGALNGLLPCGLVYVAAAGAASTGDPLNGAAYMALFGLGTWPMMLGIHWVGERLPLPSRLPLGSVTRGAVCVMGVLLVLRGLELGIPFISPELSAAGSGSAHCH